MNNHNHRPCRWYAQAPLGPFTCRAYRLIELSFACVWCPTTADAVRCALRPPCVKGKRSAVAGVNASPADWQSRDRAARRRLSPHSGDWGIVTISTTPPSRLNAVTPPLTQGRLPLRRDWAKRKHFGTTGTADSFLYTMKKRVFIRIPSFVILFSEFYSAVR